MPLRPRPEIENLPVSVHGGPDRAELKAAGILPEEVLDFSVCTSPFPPPPAVREALAGVAIERYPDSGATEFRQCLSRKLGVNSDNILAGSGTTELIRLVALAYFSPGDRVLIIEPAFGEYRTTSRIAGAEVIGCRSVESDNFVPKIDKIIDTIRQRCPRGVFLCQPNNPAGYYLTRPDVERILTACGDNGLLVIDEAYISFVEESWSSLDLINSGNLVILRSMTKDYSLAALRLGYAVASREIITALRRACPPWNVNAFAQRAGIVALEETTYFEQCRHQLEEAKRFLVGELQRIGLAVVPSMTHFFLIRVKSAPDFRAALLKQGILVRDGTSFGLPRHIRIAARTMPECRWLITVIEEMKGRGELEI